MEVMSKSRVQSFFDVNGLDVLSGETVGPTINVEGIEVLNKRDVYDYMMRSSFSGLWRDLESYVTTHDVEVEYKFKALK